MTKYKLYAVLLIVAGAGISTVYFVSAGYYPIAVVDGHFITAKTFDGDYAVVSSYYRNVMKTYENSTSTPEILTPDQIRQSVLSGLIENSLIDAGARKEVGKDLDNLVNEKINQVTDIAGIENGVKTLYGLGLDSFKKEILAPQAERDILTGSLFLKGQKMDEWLAAAKKSANVIILSGKFRWDGENVVNK